MNALWLDPPTLALRTLDEPEPRPGEALVRVLQAGICGTDLALRAGLYDFRGVPGHEFVGVVEHGPPEWCARRVVADINCGCGHCDACRRDDPHHCERRRVLGLRGAPGAFAQRLCVPIENLVAVPDTVDDDLAVFAEPLAAALAMRDTAALSAGVEVLVVGAGRLGQLLVRVLHESGAQVWCLGRSRSGLERLPAGVRGTDDRRALPGDGFHVVVDASGTAAGLRSALLAVRARGTLWLKSTLPGPQSIDLNRLVVDEIALRGSRCGSIADAVAWLSAGHGHDLPQLVTHRLPLTDGAQAFALAARPESCKVLLVP